MAVAVCVLVTFQSVRVLIENANASRMPAILVVLNQLYGAGSLATVKGDDGTVSDCEYTRMCITGGTFGQK